MVDEPKTEEKQIQIEELKNEEKTFTQEDVNRIVKKRVGDDSEKITKSILSDLGVDDIDVLKSLVATEKEREEGSKSEVQKLTDLLELERGVNAELETKLTTTQTETEIQNIAMLHGINPEKVKYFKMDYLDAKQGEGFDLDNFIAGLKEKQPDFFGFIDERPRPKNVPNPPNRGGSITQIKMSDYAQLPAAERKKYKSSDIIR